MFVLVYLDNILIYLENEEKYVKYVTKILTAMEKANLQVKPDKLFFYVTKVKYLRFIISKNGIRINLKKI